MDLEAINSAMRLLDQKILSTLGMNYFSFLDLLLALAIKSYETRIVLGIKDNFYILYPYDNFTHNYFLGRKKLFFFFFETKPLVD